jgi:hypothetical protein
VEAVEFPPREHQRYLPGHVALRHGALRAWPSVRQKIDIRYGNGAHAVVLKLFEKMIAEDLVEPRARLVNPPSATALRAIAKKNLLHGVAPAVPARSERSAKTQQPRCVLAVDPADFLGEFVGVFRPHTPRC